MNNVAESQAFVNWSTGFNLYVDGKPESACANNRQRQGWKDAQTGHQACMVIDAVIAAGGSAERADRVLAKGW